ncbi:hypothetical protein CEUSTIGMA_g5458.t1 [Chlamydomonas eustigma]|uniref:J domain-containing protein n=1 Tax=Chlamydomonas eustigma TaxID=1157962 RepID=A0A250X4N4_9CHLO|nr:hypothetical protein CEUSTIGMA_g5458.t1 [Chlamydomonas eustigma]|eukprot:GAX78016.1 hypothetical protein CEUSTIGMA_g5458.t1 [Chlamydomonas eustigma]
MIYRDNYKELLARQRGKQIEVKRLNGCKLRIQRYVRLEREIQIFLRIKYGSGLCLRSSQNEHSHTHGNHQPRDLYSLLDLDAETCSNISPDEIKLAYRKLALVHHPDINKDEKSLQRFKLASEAYNILMDPDLRRRYDALGMQSLDLKTYRSLHEHCGTLENAMTGNWNGGRSEQGSDVFTVLGLTLAETVTGGLKTVSFRAPSLCTSCQGSGMANGVLQQYNCSICNGLGKVLRTEWAFTVTVKAVQRGPCPGCSGNMLQPPGICTSCAGSGLVMSERSIMVNVPAGVEDVNVLRLREEGGVGKYGGKAGDLYVRFQVHKDSALQRVGADLYSQISLHLFDALLGCNISVDTPRGERILEIPEGTQHGDKLVLQNAGVAITSGGTVERGHHYFNVQLVIPNGDAMLEEERLLLRQSLF